MAFNVAPTSGVGPYVFSATFFDKARIDGVRYALEFRASFGTGSCFVGVSTGANTTAGVISLLNTGSYTVGTTVTVGQCRTQSLIIRNVATGVIVDYQNVVIDNT